MPGTLAPGSLAAAAKSAAGDAAGLKYTEEEFYFLFKNIARDLPAVPFL